MIIHCICILSHASCSSSCEKLKITGKKNWFSMVCIVMIFLGKDCNQVPYFVIQGKRKQPQSYGVIINTTLISFTGYHRSPTMYLNVPRCRHLFFIIGNALLLTKFRSARWISNVEVRRIHACWCPTIRTKQIFSLSVRHWRSSIALFALCRFLYSILPPLYS